jgi:hypothetical protein
MFSTAGRFFDGETANEHPVTVNMSDAALEFGGSEVNRRWWPFSGLRPVNARGPGTPLRLTHDSEPGTRLILADEAFLDELIARAPYAGGAVNYRRAAKVASVLAVVVAATAGLAYAVLTLAPQKIALILPEDLREKLGGRIESAFVGSAPRCATTGGGGSLDRLASRLREGGVDLPKFTISVFDMPMINAFSLPGGRIVVTRKLIEAATAPDQVAGVIAHEIGHVAHRDPEAQLIRATSLQVLLALFTGGAGDSTLASLAGTLAILRYSRSAERQADDYAITLLRAAAIDPMGLRRFFEQMKASEGKDPAGALGKFTSILATHPMTDERISAIEPLPPGVAREVLPAADWAALRATCGQ